MNVHAERAHLPCGLLFGILHDDGHLLSDIMDKLISDARLCVQNCAANVDTGKQKKIIHLLHP